MDRLDRHNVVQAMTTIPIFFAAHFVNKLVLNPLQKRLKVDPTSFVKRGIKSKLDFAKSGSGGIPLSKGEHFHFNSSVECTRTQALLELLHKLHNQFSKFCLVQFNKSAEQQLYLINDLELIELVQQESAQPDSAFQSQLLQPYLIQDARCRFKLTKHEYLTVLKPKFEEFFASAKASFVSTIYNNEFNYFVQNFKKKEDNDESAVTIPARSIYLHIFRVLTCYLKTSFGPRASQLAHAVFDEQQMCEFSTNDEKLFYCLLDMYDKFTLGLFTKSNAQAVVDYSKSYRKFLALIEIEYNMTMQQTGGASGGSGGGSMPTSMSYDSEIRNYFHLNESSRNTRFVYIKSVYLDSLRVYACVLSLLHDMCLERPPEDCLALKSGEQLDSSAVLADVLLERFQRLYTLDLYTIESKATPANTKPSKYLSFNGCQFERTRLVALNVYANLSATTGTTSNNDENNNLDRIAPATASSVNCNLTAAAATLCANLQCGSNESLTQTLAQCIVRSLLKHFDFYAFDTSSPSSAKTDLSLLTALATDVDTLYATRIE